MNKMLVLATFLIATIVWFNFNATESAPVVIDETLAETPTETATNDLDSDSSIDIPPIPADNEDCVNVEVLATRHKKKQPSRPLPNYIGKESKSIEVDAGLDFAADELAITDLYGRATIADGSKLFTRWLTTDEFYYYTQGTEYSKRESKDIDIRIINKYQINARVELPDVAENRYVDLYLLASDSESNWAADMVTITIEPVEPDNVAFYQIDMPDPNLLSCVEEHATQRHYTFVEDLKHLNCDNYKIADLTGIEYLFNLETFSAINNKIKDISQLKKLKKLSKINLNQNQIYDLRPLQHLPLLSELRLRENQIEDVSPLFELNLLVRLDLSQNKIERFMFREEFYLTHLNISANPLENIGMISAIKGLKTLNLAETPIHRIRDLFRHRRMAKLSAIEELDVSNCHNLLCPVLDVLEQSKVLKFTRKGECRY